MIIINNEGRYEREQYLDNLPLLGFTEDVKFTIINAETKAGGLEMTIRLKQDGMDEFLEAYLKILNTTPMTDCERRNTGVLWSKITKVLHKKRLTIKFTTE